MAARPGLQDRRGAGRSARGPTGLPLAASHERGTNNASIMANIIGLVMSGCFTYIESAVEEPWGSLGANRMDSEAVARRAPIPRPNP